MRAGTHSPHLCDAVQAEHAETKLGAIRHFSRQALRSQPKRIGDVVLRVAGELQKRETFQLSGFSFPPNTTSVSCPWHLSCSVYFFSLHMQSILAYRGALGPTTSSCVRASRSFV